MKTETLYEFMAISRLKSFNAAAKELFLARSALSTHISTLESELGFQLFDRSRNAELTMEGSIFLAHVETMLADLDAVIAQCAERASARSADNAGAIRVSYAGADPSMLALVRSLSPESIAFIPYNPGKSLLTNIADSNPDIVFFFDVSTSEKYCTDLASLGYAPQVAGLHPCSLIISAQHALVQESVGLASRDLAGCKMLLSAQPEFGYLQEVVEGMFPHAQDLHFGLLPDFTDESLQNLDLGNDLLLSMSPRTTKLFEGDPRIRIIREIDGRPFGFTQIALTRQRPRSKEVESFYEALADVISDGTWPKALSEQV